MGIAATFVNRPEAFEYMSVPPNAGGEIWNVGSIGPGASEVISFEKFYNRWTRTDNGACLRNLREA